MYWFFIILAIAIIGFVALGKLADKSLKKTQSENGIVLIEPDVKYMGGLADFEGGKNINLTLYKDRLVLIFPRERKTINLRDILAAEISSETQIRHDVSLGKIIAWGVFALGKDREVVRNYTVITYNDSIDGERKVVLDTPNNESVVRSIRDLKLSSA